MLARSPIENQEATKQLIESCLRGDQQAWNTIVERYRHRIFHIAYKFVGRHDLAEDLTQDVFMKIFRALNSFDRQGDFQSWLISVSRNLCIDHYRSVRKKRELTVHGVDATNVPLASRGPDPLTTLEYGERRAMLQRALRQLPDTLRTAVTLRDIKELTYQEIADRLDLPVGTVKSRINRGRKELARQIRQVMPAEGTDSGGNERNQTNGGRSHAPDH